MTDLKEKLEKEIINLLNEILDRTLNHKFDEQLSELVGKINKYRKRCL